MSFALITAVLFGGCTSKPEETQEQPQETTEVATQTQETGTDSCRRSVFRLRDGGADLKIKQKNIKR